MDVIARLEKSNQNLNWADLMDELLKENFERKASAWTTRRPSNPRAAFKQQAAEPPRDTKEADAPA